MKPDVNQHLQSMAKAMTEIVLPELQDKPFALEQASLVVASLKLLVDVQEQQFAYVRQEHDDIRRLLSAWYEHHAESHDPGFWQDGEKAALNTAAALGFSEMRDAVTQDKTRLRELMDRFPLPTGSPVTQLLHHYIERQLARESSWLRLTGFIPEAENVPAIAAVLETQRLSPL